MAAGGSLTIVAIAAAFSGVGIAATRLLVVAAVGFACWRGAARLGRPWPAWWFLAAGLLVWLAAFVAADASSVRMIASAMIPFALVAVGGGIVALLIRRRRQLDEHAMLLRVGRAAASSLELRTVLAEIARASLGIAGTECCTILLWHPNEEELEVGADQTIPDWPGVDEPGTRDPVDGADRHRQLLTSRDPMLLEDDDPSLSPDNLKNMADWGARSVLIFPLWIGDECVGLLQIYARRLRAFGTAAFRLGRDVAAQTALAIHNARLLEETRRHAEEQTALLRVSRAVSSSLKLSEVLKEVGRASLGVAGAESCEIELWHQDRDEIELVAQQHIADWINGKTNVGKRFPLSDWPLARRVLTTREPLIFDQSNPALTDFERKNLFDDSTQSGFCVPIVVDDRCLGLFSLYSRQPHAFSEQAVSLGRDLANQTALAIERAQLHAALEARARTDGLTGLLNRGAIEEALDAELTRARRAASSLGLLLVDLDGFKHVNDRYGHPVGDRVLQDVAAVLRRGVREGDFVGRYGGDEFVAVLPDADAAGARAVAERILAATADRVVVELGESRLPVSLSIGFAVYPDDGGTHEELVAAADGAMYRAKESGGRLVGGGADGFRIAQVVAAR